MAAMTPGPARVFAFDWLRGLAVLVMIQTHALALLTPRARTDPFFWWLVRLDGLVAPSFIFSAGFALALVQVRAGLAGQLARQARKSLTRVGEVLLVASLMNSIWFPVFSEPKWLLRIDILQCIGLSLLLLLAVLVLLAKRPGVLRVTTLAMALAIFAVSPLLEQTTGFWSLFVNNRPGLLDATTGSTFPLLPWAGYVFLGASFGATVALQQERALWAWLGLLWGLGALLWSQERWFQAAYPAHDFWVTNPANAAQRWTLVLTTVGLLRLVEVRWRSFASSRLARWVAAFGVSSLSAYFFHEILLFHWRIGLFTRLWRERAEWPLFWVLLVALIAATWGCVLAWSRLWPQLRGRVSAWAARPRPAS